MIAYRSVIPPARPRLLGIAGFAAALAGAGGAVAVVIPTSGALIGIDFLALCGVALYLANRRAPNLQLILLSAFAVRAAAALAHVFLTPLPESGADAVVFEQTAWTWSLGGWAMVPTHFTFGAETYSWLLSLVYLVFGRSPLLAQSVNVLLGTLVVLNVYRLAELLHGERVARRIAWLAVLFPSLILYSAVTVREAVTIYPATLGVMLLTRWRARGGLGYFIGGSAAFIVAGTFHGAMLVGYLGFLGCLGIVQLWHALRSGNLALLSLQLAILTVLVPLGTIAVLNVRTDYGRMIDLLANPEVLIRFVDASAAAHAEGRLAYLQGLPIASATDALWVLPLRLVYFLASPFPWTIRAIGDAILSIDGLTYAILVPAAIIGARRADGRAPAWPAVAVAVALAVAFSFGTSNSGTAFRHRAKIAPILMAVAAPLAFRRPNAARAKEGSFATREAATA